MRRFAGYLEDMQREIRSDRGGMLQVRCVSCGCPEPEPETTPSFSTPTCRSCGRDLFSRPPRSYAAMEGFDPRCIPRRSDAWQDALRIKLVERWLCSVFLILLAGILLLSIIIP